MKELLALAVVVLVLVVGYGAFELLLGKCIASYEYQIQNRRR